MRVGIFIADSNGGYPVPASKGGAVSTLVEHLVSLNNEKQQMKMEVVSIYDAKAERMAQQYPNITFTWIKSPKIIKLLDNFVFHFVRVCFPNKKAVSYKTLFSLIFYILKAAKILKKKPFDKVVLENNILLAWSIKLSKYKGDYYYHFHNVPRINAKCSDVFAGCKLILCVSKYVEHQIASKENPIGPIAREKIRVLYNCVDTNLFHPLDAHKKIELRKKYGIQEEQKVILFVGRLSEEKGIDKLLNAMKQVKNKNVIVLIAGSYLHNINIKDSYQVMLHNLANELEDRVKFTGYVPQCDVYELYGLADAAILPSMWEEPAGLTIIEAMACGIPVITTKSGGIPEYSCENSIVLERNDDLVKNIAQIITELMEGKRNYNVKEARERVNIKFSKNNYLENFYNLIK